MTTTVLLTGFGPFGEHPANPSWDAVAELAAVWSRPGTELVVECLPVSYARATERVATLVEQVRPVVTVCAGLAASRSRISLERVAVNLADARIPDVDGARPVDVEAVPAAPTAMLSTLPVKAALHRLTQAGIPAELSLSAGTYVCNAVMLAALHATTGHAGRAGFVHVPPAETLPPATTARALETVVATALEVGEDDHAPGGRED